MKQRQEKAISLEQPFNFTWVRIKYYKITLNGLIIHAMRHAVGVVSWQEK